MLSDDAVALQIGKRLTYGDGREVCVESQLRQWLGTRIKTFDITLFPVWYLNQIDQLEQNRYGALVESR